MNVVSEHVEGDLKTVKFATTPIMSTYLVAFIVGDLEYVETQTAKSHGSGRVTCRVYTLPGESEQGRFALDLSAKVLDLYADLFGLPYPLPKLDMVAIPDFASGTEAGPHTAQTSQPISCACVCVCKAPWRTGAW